MAAVRARGLRLSSARRLVLEALFAADAPVTAERARERSRQATCRRATSHRSTATSRRSRRSDSCATCTWATAPAATRWPGRARREYVSCERCGAYVTLAPDALDGVRAAVREACGYTARFTHFPVVGLCPGLRERGGLTRVRPRRADRRPGIGRGVPARRRPSPSCSACATRPTRTTSPRWARWWPATTVAARGAPGRLGMAWGLGHATTLFAFGVPIVLFRGYLPETVQQVAELAVGVLIMGLALRLLVRWRRGELARPGPARATSTAAGARARPLSAYGIGLVHGMGGSAGVGVLLLAAIPDHVEALAALVVFAACTAVSMSVASTTFGYAITREPVLRALHRGRARARGRQPGVRRVVRARRRERRALRVLSLRRELRQARAVGRRVERERRDVVLVMREPGRDDAHLVDLVGRDVRRRARPAGAAPARRRCARSSSARLVRAARPSRPRRPPASQNASKRRRRPGAARAPAAAARASRAARRRGVEQRPPAARGGGAAMAARS